MNGNDTSTPGGSRKNPAITRLELRLEWWSFSVPSRVGLSDDAGKDRTRRLAFHVCRGIDRPWHGDGDERHRSARRLRRSEEHTSELQSLMRISYAVFCLKKKTTQ